MNSYWPRIGYSLESIAMPVYVWWDSDSFGFQFLMLQVVWFNQGRRGMPDRRKQQESFTGADKRG